MSLKIGLSSIRGIWNKSLTPSIVRDFTLSFLRWIEEASGSRPSGSIAIARDFRKHSQEIASLVKISLQECGWDVFDLEVAPTPVLVFFASRSDVCGAMMVTASHNPAEWNGLKFVSRRGCLLASAEWKELLSHRESIGQKKVLCLSKHLGKTTVQDGCIAHKRYVLNHLGSELTERIRKHRFKVAFDPVNGAGVHAGRALLEALHCSTIALHSSRFGVFERIPEPLPQSLQALSDCVIKNNCDVGFALDPDGDRLALMDEMGQAPGEEVTVALVADSYFRVNPGIVKNVVVNFSTSRMIEDLCLTDEISVCRSAVGEAFVVEKMHAIHAEFGAEGNGGIIFGSNPTRDSLIAMAWILAGMTFEKSISRWILKMPRYYLVKTTMSWFKDFQRILEDLPKQFSNVKSVSFLDGLRLEFDDLSWLHVRSSNTEWLIRLFVESTTLEDANQKVEKALQFFMRNRSHSE